MTRISQAKDHPFLLRQRQAARLSRKVCIVVLPSTTTLMTPLRVVIGDTVIEIGRERSDSRRAMCERQRDKNC